MPWNIIIYSFGESEKNNLVYGYYIVDKAKYKETISLLVKKRAKLLETRNDIEGEFDELSKKASDLVSRLNRKEKVELYDEIEKIVERE